MTTAGVVALSVAGTTVAIIVAQGLGHYNLTTTVLGLFGAAEKFEKRILAKLTSKYMTTATAVKSEIGSLQGEIKKL